MSLTSTAAPISASARTYASDRRLHQRYPISLDVECQVFYRKHVHRLGFCRTINISSRGVLLDVKDRLPMLSSIELSIKWPLPLDGSIPLKLIMRGSVVRVDDNGTAVEVTEHEFRTARQYQVMKSGQR